ncbi:MAG: hypothetical protein EPO39_04285 [Candidatus Manganitrophaceae bacterium]|nr:MAG: hypothetical protein EPO39_04285 [Candidatus Manganitrophaceae bacterium]
MSTLYGVICPYCHKKAYVQVPDTPPPGPNDGESEVTEESPCTACGKTIIAYTKSNAEWGVRQKT